MPRNKKTPLSDGVFLNEREIDAAFNECKLLKQFKGDFDRLAEHHSVRLFWLKNWENRHGFMWLNDGVPEILIPHSTKLGECIAFEHELHHHLFSPEKIATREMGREEIARWEGKADAFAALVAMPLLPDGNDGQLDEIEIYRLFGPHHKRNAHYRILHAKHYGV